ncbi:MAG: leucine-rich repeat domain-containing protein, partial [Clostridia bacterium]|nr:leucine-rich repeat domain-containing protein [Clostridia bacterium]
MKYNNNSVRFAYTGICEVGKTDEGVYWALDKNDIITIINYSTNASSVTLPKTINGFDVSVIGNNLIKGNTTLKNIIISDGITSISDYAFSGCTALESITIPNSITTISDYAFSGCTVLTRVDYQGTLYNWCKITFVSAYANPLANGASLYINDTPVTEVIATDGFQKIGDFAFYNCKSIKKVILGDDIQLGIDAFYGYKNGLFYEDGSRVVFIRYSNINLDKVREITKIGATITLPTAPSWGAIPSGATFFGWYNEDGTLYEKGATITVTDDMRLFPAVGKEISTADELCSYINSNQRNYLPYARLTADITIYDKQVQAYWMGGVGVIDLNGHTLTSENDYYGFGFQRTGMIFVGEGTINFTARKPTGAFFTTAYHGYGDGNQIFWIGKNVTVNSNVVLAKITNYMDIEGLPQIKIYGTINAPALVETAGTRSMTIDIYKGAKITVTEGATKPLVYDSSDRSSSAVLTIHDGNIITPDDFKGVILDGETRIKVVYAYTCTHKNEQKESGREATCTETGLTDGVICADCGKILTPQEVIPVKDHTEQTVNGKEATCTETGLTEGTKCSVCGEILVKQEIIP